MYPLALISTLVYLASEFICLSLEVNSAKKITIRHCPNAKKNSNAMAKSKFEEIVAIAIILANIGDEQGLAARAKNVPTKKGNKNKLPDLF